MAEKSIIQHTKFECMRIIISQFFQHPYLQNRKRYRAGTYTNMLHSMVSSALSPLHVTKVLPSRPKTNLNSELCHISKTVRNMGLDLAPLRSTHDFAQHCDNHVTPSHTLNTSDL